LNIPPGWLCYLAPEIIRRLKPLNRGQDKLPYTFDSDIYAFGLVFFMIIFKYAILSLFYKYI